MTFLAEEMLLIKTQIHSDPGDWNGPLSASTGRLGAFSGFGSDLHQGPFPGQEARRAVSHAFVSCLECGDVYTKLL